MADMSPCPQRIMQSVSGGQSGAAFGSSAVQYLPAAFGCHTRAEPVGSFALDDAWLKCSFHIKSRKIPNVYSCIRSRPGHGLTCLPWRGLFCSISGYSCFIYIGMHISASVPIYDMATAIPTYSYQPGSGSRDTASVHFLGHVSGWSGTTAGQWNRREEPQKRDANSNGFVRILQFCCT